jgi:hypothetical protein
LKCTWLDEQLCSHFCRDVNTGLTFDCEIRSHEFRLTSAPFSNLVLLAQLPPWWCHCPVCLFGPLLYRAKERTCSRCLHKMRYCNCIALSIFASIVLRECVAGFAGFDFLGRRSLTSTEVRPTYPRRASGPFRPRRTNVAPLPAKFDKRDDDSDDRDRRDALARNQKRTDVRLFLTQRAIQSFVHLLLETRDPHTVRWIEVNHNGTRP